MMQDIQNDLPDTFLVLSLEQKFVNIANSSAYIVEYICEPKQSENIVEAGMVDCPSFQICLFHILTGAGLGCVSVYLLICL